MVEVNPDRITRLDEMSKRRITLTINEEALILLQGLTTDHKRGEFVEQLILAAASGQQPQAPGILERMELRLQAVEHKVEQLSAAQT